MTYQVLARAWRPQRFADLLGQEAAVQTLRNALEAGAFGQAYLFSGLRGVGKTTAARLLAKAVNCAHGPTPEPCGECDSCREIAAGSSIDVIEIDAATHTQVEKVRDLQDLLRYRPTRDRFRVIIFDEVHMLSASAFNALLKTIEEPPPYILWIFATTERSKVPDTILSRCQQLEFRPVGAELIRGRLQAIADSEGFSLTPSAAAAIAAAADGSVRDALSLLDQLRAFAAGEVDDEAVAAVLGVPPIDEMAELLAALAEGRMADGLAQLRRLLAGGQDATVLYQELGRVLRLVMYLAVDPSLEPTLSEAHRGRLQPLAEALGALAASRMLGLWVEQESVLREAANREVALEVASLRLARWPSVQSIEGWLGGGDETPPPASGTGGGRRRGRSAGRSAGQAAGGDPPATAAAAPTPERPPAAPAEDAEEPSPDPGDLHARAASDPGVMLAARVLGGEVVAVRRDGGDS